MAQFNFTDELEGQEKFKQHCGIADIIRTDYNTDGFTQSALLEMKLRYGSKTYGLPKAKKQFKDYRQKLENNGEYSPRYFLAIGLNDDIAEVFEDDPELIDEFECNFVEKFSWQHPEKVKHYCTCGLVCKYSVKADNVLGLADKFYRENPTANTVQFFEDFLKIPNDKFAQWQGLEQEFRHILDCLTDPMSQKVLGKFYTPDRYVKIAAEMVRQAVADVKQRGFPDYIILDRCAGSGNLLRCFDKEELSHCVVNTFEAKEYLALNQLYRGKVRRIIPHNYKPIGTLFTEGTTLEGGDALTEYFPAYFAEEFKARDEGKLAIIMLENPPYNQTNSNKEGGTKSKYKKSFIHLQMPSGGEDLDEQFVWSAYEYFKPLHYIHFGPVKIWKSRHLIDKHIYDAYLCNREHFHAGKSAIALIHWGSEDENYDAIHFRNDADDDFIVRKVFEPISTLYENDGKENGICVVEARNFSFASPRLTGSINDGNGYGNKWVSRENLLNVLLLFCAARDEYAETGFGDYRVVDTLYKSADGGTAYRSDADFLNDCLIYTLLTNKNKCSIGNELYPYGFSVFTEKSKHRKLLKLWNQIHSKANIFGLNNIEKNPDFFLEVYNEKKRKTEFVWKPEYLELDEWIKELKVRLKEFYTQYIRPKMLEYELLK